MTKQSKTLIALAAVVVVCAAGYVCLLYTSDAADD